MSWSSPHGTPLPDWRRRTLIMGIMNLTPDSFSDGGELPGVDDALRRAEALLDEGADVLDLGAESTRPGAAPVAADDELARLLPVVQALRRRFPRAALSVDTYKPDVAAAAVAAGADLVNDVEGGRFGAHGDESPMGAACAAARCPLILMHRRREANYREFWPEMLGDLRASLHAARSAGMAPEQLWTDPGFGFGKTPAQNLMLVRDLAKVAALGYPVLLGTSRKSTLGLVLDEPDPLRRGPGNDVTAAWGIAQGCSMLRVHDVAAIRPVVRMADALRQTPRTA
ncbi:MAG: dihydropteroate synthase [Opitutales bacterium]|jgi:dihydropteroate synthase|nr:dihydropteroate synthase [Opitutales bacterium]MDP4658447.1 dihydropteroate synthase [Opitutales bacterium]MDP4774927.1 dihydropteroate synthase [Opitutales bacterium]MDP4786879.1 dihydropteroate synthase [Opitutales bacterium]MDP4860583.1 dihydropteroate synthase [Opitutales bacterium]